MKCFRLFCLLFCICWSATLFAGEPSESTSYNLSRAEEALNQDDLEEALHYYQLELKQHPENYGVQLMVAKIQLAFGEYGKALTATSQAMNVVPKKDKESKSLAYYIAAYVYQCLGDTVRALDNYSSAIALNKRCDDCYLNRGDWYFQIGELDLSSRDFNKAIQLNPNNVTAYDAMARNAMHEEEYAKALTWCDKADQITPDAPLTLSIRSGCYLGLKQYDRAMDVAIKSIEATANNEAMNSIAIIADSDFTVCQLKLKEQLAKNDTSMIWNYLMGMIHEVHKDNAKAIVYYQKAVEQDENPFFMTRIALCYAYQYRYDDATIYCQRAYELDTTQTKTLALKINIEIQGHLLQQGAHDVDLFLSKEPDQFTGYYLKGIILNHQQRYAEAIQVLTTGLYLNQESCDLYYHRGKAYRMMGDFEKSDADFRKAIDLAQESEDNFMKPFIYFYINDTVHALECMNQQIKETNDKKEMYYNAACLYALMSQPTEALQMLTEAFENGYGDFNWLNWDPDLESIRNSDEMIRLVEQYRSAWEANEVDQESIEYNS